MVIRHLRAWWAVAAVGSAREVARTIEEYYRYHVIKFLAEEGLFDFLQEPRTYGQILARFGITGHLMLGGVVLAIGLTIFLLESNKRMPIKNAYFGGIIVESAIYAFVLGIVIWRIPSFQYMIGRYLVKSKKFPGLAILPNSLAPKFASNREMVNVPTLPASIHGRRTAKACGAFRSGSGSTSCKLPSFIHSSYQTYSDKTKPLQQSTFR